MDSLRSWELIANYESYELIKDDYNRLHGRTPNTQHAREIAAPFSHARSYFRSARGAELTVKPLLLYYGVVSLSRGLTLLLSRGLREAAITPSHGLSTKNWAASLSRVPPVFRNLKVEVTGGGSFVELTRAIGSRSLLRSGSSAVNVKHSMPPPTTGAEFTLGEILSRLPELQEHYWRWTSETDCMPLAVDADPGSPQAYLKLQKYGKSHLTRIVGDRIFETTPFQFVQEDAAVLMYQGPNSLEKLPGLTDQSERNFGNYILDLAA